MTSCLVSLNEKGHYLVLAISILRSNQHSVLVSKCWSDIESELFDLDENLNTLSPKALSTSKERFIQLSTKFEEVSNSLTEFLGNTRTLESEVALQEHLEVYNKRKTIVNCMIKTISDKVLDVADNMSQKLSSIGKASKTSSSSSSSILLKKQIKVQSERAKLKYLQQEIGLSKKKAELDAEIRLTEQERETAIAEAEVEAAKQHVEFSSLQINDNLQETIPKEEIVNRYTSSMESMHVQPQPTGTFGHSGHPVDESIPQPPPAPMLANDNHYSYTPLQQGPVVNDLTSFLLKKDLLTSRFIMFDDKPEAYATWRTSFQSIITELHATHREELDLLIKWLGPESKKFATSMKTANSKDPQKAVQLMWERLHGWYGSPELVESALKSKLDKFPTLTNSDNRKLYELADILAEIASAKEDPTYSTILSYFDSSTGILPVVRKLPYNIQEKWITRASEQKKRTGCAYPPFTFFLNFIQEMSRIRNDPGLVIQDRKSGSPSQRTRTSGSISSRKTETNNTPPMDPCKKCPLHNDFHALNKCRTFRNKPIKERMELLKQHGICFKCCNSSEHRAKDCLERIMCSICSNNSHPTALHLDKPRFKSGDQNKLESVHGGEGKGETDVKSNSISNKCAQICNKPGGKSCSKTVLVRVQCDGSHDSIKVYAIIDDQSDQTLPKSELFDILGIHSAKQDFMIKTCAGVNTMQSRIATNLIVSSLDGSAHHKLPSVVECDNIPDNRNEIASPEVAHQYPHLVDIVHDIPPIDLCAKKLLLIGRDVIEAHYVHDHRIAPRAPYAQSLSLGWTLIGETCLNGTHLPSVVTTNKTYLQWNGRHSVLVPYNNHISVKETGVSLIDKDVKSSLFLKTPDYDKPGLSQEDRLFLQIMEKSLYRDEQGKWTAPLPFKSDCCRLPNNYSLALKRAKSLDASLRKNPTKMVHALSFMQKIFDNGHAVQATPLSSDIECWFLPIFAIYHPEKPNQIRMVFDSLAVFEGVSLNSVLLTGPDLTNSLLGVLLRFRKDRIAITADIEQMFYCFKVAKSDQNFLRFLWYEDNNPTKKLIEHIMTVHVFGNSPSPSVATFGLESQLLTTLIRMLENSSTGIFTSTMH